MSQVAGLGPTARARAILANHLAQGGDADRTGLAAGLANAARCEPPNASSPTTATPPQIPAPH